MTDARSALERLTRALSVQPDAPDERLFGVSAGDLRALLSTVEQMRKALKNLIDIREGEGGTLRIDPKTGWPLAWGECPVAIKEVPHG